jgi:hypothetical protein
MTALWPPPPDLESIRELVRTADVEGLIEIHGAPADEYDTEADEIVAAIRHLPTAKLTVPNLSPILESIWSKSFTPDEAELALRRPTLQGLAEQITRSFGPQAEPQTHQREQA